MNWKFWTWPGQIRQQEAVLNELIEDKASMENYKNSPIHADELKIARRALARTKDAGLTDDQMAEAFTHLLENKGFEAILQLLTSEELEAVDNMVAMDATPDQMKHQAGAVSALSNLHARLIELEQQAKEMAKRTA